MTWSMGFKAPSFHDMLLEYLHDFEDHHEHCRYTDAGLEKQENPGEVTPQQLRQLKSWFIQQLGQDSQEFSRWIARFLSRGAEVDEPSPGISPWEGASIKVEPNPFVRFNFIRIEGQTRLYANGEEFVLSLSLAKKLTGKSSMSLSPETENDKRVILKLLRKGFLLQQD